MRRLHLLGASLLGLITLPLAGNSLIGCISGPDVKTDAGLPDGANPDGAMPPTMLTCALTMSPMPKTLAPPKADDGGSLGPIAIDLDHFSFLRYSGERVAIIAPLKQGGMGGPPPLLVWTLDASQGDPSYSARVLPVPNTHVTWVGVLPDGIGVVTFDPAMHAFLVWKILTQQLNADQPIPPPTPTMINFQDKTIDDAQGGALVSLGGNDYFFIGMASAQSGPKQFATARVTLGGAPATASTSPAMMINGGFTSSLTRVNNIARMSFTQGSMSGITAFEGDFDTNAPMSPPKMLTPSMTDILVGSAQTSNGFATALFEGDLPTVDIKGIRFGITTEPSAASAKMLPFLPLDSKDAYVPALKDARVWTFDPGRPAAFLINALPPTGPGATFFWMDSNGYFRAKQTPATPILTNEGQLDAIQTIPFGAPTDKQGVFLMAWSVTSGGMDTIRFGRLLCQ